MASQSDVRKWLTRQKMNIYISKGFNATEVAQMLNCNLCQVRVIEKELKLELPRGKKRAEVGWEFKNEFRHRDGISHESFDLVLSQPWTKESKPMRYDHGVS